MYIYTDHVHVVTGYWATELFRENFDYEAIDFHRDQVEEEESDTP